MDIAVFSSSLSRPCGFAAGLRSTSILIPETGPLSDRPGFDYIAQAYSGITSLVLSSDDIYGLAYDDFHFDLADNGGGTPGGVPEPASWALMILGFGLAGAALRRQRAAIA